MAEGVDKLSNSLENISLSSTPEERNALDAALNLPDDHGMIPDAMVKKMKRRDEERRAKEERERSREKEERDKMREKEDRRKRARTDSDKERRKHERREWSEGKRDTPRKRKADDKPNRAYSPQDRRLTGIMYDFL